MSAKIQEILERKRQFAVFPMIGAAHCADMLGLPLEVMCANGEKLANALEYAYDMHGYDMIMISSHPYFEAQALGYEVVFEPEPKLTGKKTEPPEDGTEVMVEAATYLKKRLKIPLPVSIQSPYALAVQLAGGAKKASARLDQALQFQMEYLEKLLKLKMDILITDNQASSTPPDTFTKLALPPLQTIVKRVKETDCLCGIHACGDVKDLVPQLDSLGGDILSIEDITLQTQTLKMGGISPKTLLAGDKKSIEKEIKTALNQDRLILSTHGEVQPNTNPKHLETFMTLAKKNTI